MLKKTQNNGDFILDHKNIFFYTFNIGTREIKIYVEGGDILEIYPEGEDIMDFRCENICSWWKIYHDLYIVSVTL